MDDNSAIFGIMLLAVIAATILVLATMRNRTRIAVAKAGGGRETELLAAENERLRGQLNGLTERLAVLERIATDPAERTAREIEQLRHA